MYFQMYEMFIAYTTIIFYLFIIHRTKRARFGVKVFFSCPAAERFLGYSYDFEIYYGHNSNFAVPDELPDELTISEQIVIRPLQGHLDQGCMVITDHW